MQAFSTTNADYLGQNSANTDHRKWVQDDIQSVGEKIVLFSDVIFHINLDQMAGIAAKIMELRKFNSLFVIAVK